MREFVAGHLVPRLAKCQVGPSLLLQVIAKHLDATLLPKVILVDGWMAQGGCKRNAAASWGTLVGWSRKQTNSPVLIIFENSEHAMPEVGLAHKVRSDSSL